MLKGVTLPAKITTDEFIKRANIAHGSKFTYSKVEYVNAHTNVVITCPVHGDFEQRPMHHNNGFGCPKCSSKHQYSTEEFIDKANEVHAGRYVYSSTVYTSKEEKVVITCPIHGDFEQRAGAHLRGQGCSKCTKTGFNPGLPAVLYYLKVNGGQAYKIGITTRSVDQRFISKDLAIIEVLATTYYEVGKDAFNKEQEILKKYKEYKYTGDNLLRDGNSELFSQDVLGLDTKSI